jgi:3-deoxy-7-phosphoheptulonate synthase
MNKFSDKRSFGPKPNYPLVREYKRQNKDFIIIGGPCSVESYDQISDIAKSVALSGATHLRGGVFRAGTYPGQNVGYIQEELISLFHHCAKNLGLKNIIEVLDYKQDQLDMVANYCDVFQVGARSQQNYSLLKALGKYNKPVFLKRNMGSTVDEWLGSAEHLLKSGVTELYLIERGSSTFHTDVRWTQCIHTIPSVKSITDIPVIIDASHGSGRADLVKPMTLAGIAAGASGLLIECHTNPEESLSDADQAVTLEEFKEIVIKSNQLRKLLYA